MATETSHWQTRLPEITACEPISPHFEWTGTRIYTFPR
jgi:hypothetical protein